MSKIYKDYDHCITVIQCYDIGFNFPSIEINLFSQIYKKYISVLYLNIQNKCI